MQVIGQQCTNEQLCVTVNNETLPYQYYSLDRFLIFFLGGDYSLAMFVLEGLATLILNLAYPAYWECHFLHE